MKQSLKQDLLRRLSDELVNISPPSSPRIRRPLTNPSNTTVPYTFPSNFPANISSPTQFPSIGEESDVNPNLGIRLFNFALNTDNESLLLSSSQTKTPAVSLLYPSGSELDNHTTQILVDFDNVSNQTRVVEIRCPCQGHHSGGVGHVQTFEGNLFDRQAEPSTYIYHRSSSARTPDPPLSSSHQLICVGWHQSRLERYGADMTEAIPICVHNHLEYSTDTYPRVSSQHDTKVLCSDCRIRLENDCKDHNITCSDCGKILYTPNEIVVPLMNGDPSYNSFRCHMCNDAYKEYADYLGIFQSGNIECIDCKKSLSQREEACETLLGPRGSFRCRVCDLIKCKQRNKTTTTLHQRHQQRQQQQQQQQQQESESKIESLNRVEEKVEKEIDSMSTTSLYNSIFSQSQERLRSLQRTQSQNQHDNHSPEDYYDDEYFSDDDMYFNDFDQRWKSYVVDPADQEFYDESYDDMYYEDEYDQYINTMEDKFNLNVDQRRKKSTNEKQHGSTRGHVVRSFKQGHGKIAPPPHTNSRKVLTKEQKSIASSRQRTRAESHVANLIENRERRRNNALNGRKRTAKSKREAQGVPLFRPNLITYLRRSTFVYSEHQESMQMWEWQNEEHSTWRQYSQVLMSEIRKAIATNQPTVNIQRQRFGGNERSQIYQLTFNSTYTMGTQTNLETGYQRKIRRCPPKRKKTVLQKSFITLKIGMCVLAKFDKRNQFYSGWIDGVNDDGTYAVQFEDGDYKFKCVRNEIAKRKTYKKLDRVTHERNGRSGVVIDIKTVPVMTKKGTDDSSWQRYFDSTSKKWYRHNLVTGAVEWETGTNSGSGSGSGGRGIGKNQSNVIISTIRNNNRNDNNSSSSNSSSNNTSHLYLYHKSALRYSVKFDDGTIQKDISADRLRVENQGGPLHVIFRDTTSRYDQSSSYRPSSYRTSPYQPAHRPYRSHRARYERPKKDVEEWTETELQTSMNQHGFHFEGSDLCNHTIQCMEIMEELHKRSNKPQTLEVSHLEQLGSETVENVTLFGDDLCVICQDTFEEGQVIRRLDCGHTFHKDCIDPYLTNYKMECPTDRKKVMVPEVEKITVEKKKTLLQQEEEPAQSTVEDAKVAEVIIGLQNMGIPVPNRAMILSELAMMGGNAIMTIQYFVNQVLGGGQDY